MHPLSLLSLVFLLYSVLVTAVPQQQYPVNSPLIQPGVKAPVLQPIVQKPVAQPILQKPAQSSLSKLTRAEDGCPKGEAKVYARCVELVRGVEASLPAPIAKHAVSVISARKPTKNAALATKYTAVPAQKAAVPQQAVTPQQAASPLVRPRGPLRRRAGNAVAPTQPSSAGLREFFHFKWLHKVKGALTVTRDRILDWITEEEADEATKTLQSSLSEELTTGIPSLASRPASPSAMVMSQLTAKEQVMLSAMAAQSTTDYASTLMTLLNGQVLKLVHNDIKILFKQFVRDIRNGVGFVPMMKDLGQHAVRLLHHTAAALVGATHALLLFSLPIAISAAISSIVVAIFPPLAGFYKFTEPYVIANLYVLVDRTISPTLLKLRARLQGSNTAPDIALVIKETGNPSATSTTVPAGAAAMVADTTDADKLEIELMSFKQ
ncbi:hypothetical protein THASP1DRAFT_27640 [Thamnocephalis sphaerospora]|uniref:Uncharacterized protein n=1 Tax=Thamnocephalis sphaerospora TaxID=78915 RepID=A0A4P9XW84_9FUNG|nr:hypothetical protein THASP1DRAFT_27640 [Thamnocephalis sphaerospora]|eukprot:RKP10585.1 hypothetical protein THASP1DRAFT_27640 [Thamnocephalis sphaerospora]